MGTGDQKVDVRGARSPQQEEHRPSAPTTTRPSAPLHSFEFGKLSFILQLEWRFALLKEERRLVEKFAVENGRRVPRIPSEANNI